MWFQHIREWPLPSGCILRLGEGIDLGPDRRKHRHLKVTEGTLTTHREGPIKLAPVILVIPEGGMLLLIMGKEVESPQGGEVLLKRETSTVPSGGTGNRVNHGMTKNEYPQEDGKTQPT